jgi:transposase
MKRVELYQKVRRAVLVEKMSRRGAARYFGIDRKTVDKMLVLSSPAPHGRIGRTFSRKLEGLTDFIDQILADDHSVHAKQQHTVIRIFERLRDEHGFTGGETIVREYVALQKRRTREVFVPLSHRPGHAQVDFGEADAIVDGQLVWHHYFCMDLPHSDAPFFKTYPAEVAEAFCDGHVEAFAFFGGVPRSILYDNTKLAVARILGDGTRTRSQMFSALQSHYLFEDKFGRPGKGNDKGNVEGLVGLVRRRFMVPMCHLHSYRFACDLHVLMAPVELVSLARLEHQWDERWNTTARGFALRFCPTAGIAPDCIIGTFKTLALQKVVNARHPQAVAPRQRLVLRQQGVELFLKGPEPRQRLNLALVIKCALR